MHKTVTCVFQTVQHTPKGSISQFFIVCFVSLHGFQSHGTLPCEGGFAHTCTNHVFKEYYYRLKWLLKGFLCVVKLLYLSNRTWHGYSSP